MKELYEFEKYLAKNAMDISVIDARRCAVGVRKALEAFRHETAPYTKMNRELYYREIVGFLEYMANRLEAPPCGCVDNKGEE